MLPPDHPLKDVGARLPRDLLVLPLGHPVFEAQRAAVRVSGERLLVELQHRALRQGTLPGRMRRPLQPCGSLSAGNIRRIFDKIFETPCAEWYTSVDSRIEVDC
eukprot:3177038-Pyramimonas_sp.AAC.1